ncbi:MAG: hypothetical protein AB9842_02760 [Bacteroidales bacterium]
MKTLTLIIALLCLPVFYAAGQASNTDLAFYLPIQGQDNVDSKIMVPSHDYKQPASLNINKPARYSPPFKAMTCLFLAGMADGTVEILRHDYDNFKKVFPNANDSYWNSEISWKNKWKDGDPEKGEKFFQSAYLLAWTTDGYHLLRSTNKALICGAIVFNINDRNKPFLHYLYDFVICSATYTAGFTTSYSLIFKH